MVSVLLLSNYSTYLTTVFTTKLLFSVLFLIYRSRTVRRRSILLTGLCNSGKTVLFARLVHGQLIKTFTSMKENTGEYAINGVSST